MGKLTVFYISAFQLLDMRGEGKILRSKYLQWTKTKHTFWTSNEKRKATMKYNK